jgi:hypothetical protein
MIISPITDNLLKSVLSSDQAIYPVNLAFEIIKEWAEQTPELSVSFHANDAISDEPSGVLVAIPLSPLAWNRLLSGKLKEQDVKTEHIVKLATQKHISIGIHIYHIEKYKPWNCTVFGYFSEYAIQYLKGVCSKCDHNVIGFSGMSSFYKPLASITNTYKHLLPPSLG